jgi:hypothetical protein
VYTKKVAKLISNYHVPSGADNSRGPGGPMGPLCREPLKTQYNPLKTLLGLPDFGPRDFG